MQESGNKAAQNETLPETSRQIQVKGNRIEEKTDAKKNELSSSGLKWTILAAVFLAITLFEKTLRSVPQNPVLFCPKNF